MKITPRLIIWLLLGCALRAQDLSPAPLVWLDQEETPDQLPTPAGLPTLEPSEAQKAVHEPGYIQFNVVVTKKGEPGVRWISSSSPWLPKDRIELTSKFGPAKREGGAVASQVALCYIYNPAEAGTKRPNAIPRLLAVQPAFFPRDRQSDREEDCRVRVRVGVDADGRVGRVEAPAEPDQELARIAIQSVKGWTFAPARKDGHPVPAELELAVVLDKERILNVGEVTEHPAPLAQVNPSYPYALRRAGLSGEVELEFVISVEGRVTDVVVKRATHKGFVDTALQAVRQWRFVPAGNHGRPVPCRAVQLLQFAVDDQAGAGINGFKIVVPKSWPPAVPEELRFDAAPHLVEMESPVYPREDLLANRPGKVALAYVVDREGKVAEVTALPGATTPGMAGAAIAALERFRFTPPGRQGKPCHALLRIEFEFFPGGEMGQCPVSESARRILRQLGKADSRIVDEQQLDHELARPSQPSRFHSGRTGEAVVECVVDTDGIPRVPRVVSATSPALGFEAIQTLSDWRFARPTVRGKPVNVLMRLPLKFN